MFTGIIEKLGRVERKTYQRGMLQLTVGMKDPFDKVEIGESISVNGVCLTIIKIDKNHLTFEVMQETLDKSNLKYIKIKDTVNLERALKADSRLSGHFVSGHIDEVGIIRKKEFRGGSYIFQISIPKELTSYIVSKGSIAVDGISLTVSEVRGNVFSVHIIPHTYKNTSLGIRSNSDKVNIEVDQLAKYVAKREESVL